MNALQALVTSALQSVQSVFATVASSFLGVSPPQHHTKDLSLDIVRPDDLLILTIDFYNVTLTAASATTPARLARRAGGYVFMVVHFPPQSFGEEAFLEDSNSDKTPILPAPVSARIAGESQIVLRIADALLPFDVTLETLLKTIEQGAPLVQRTIRQPLAVPANQPAYFNGPRGQFTAIEAPYRLILSHDAGSRWEHALAAAKNKAGDRTELWHTRLSANATARAVWSPDVNADPTSPPSGDGPFMMSLRPSDRHGIVHSTSNSSLDGNQPVTVDRFMLSSQGAWLSLHGQWQTILSLVEWKHVLTSGRDQFARVVTEGRMFPFGHRAVRVEITERKLALANAGTLEGKPTAYLLKRIFVVVREPTKFYGHRHVPFRNVTIKTLTTPDLAAPAVFPPGSSVPPERSFWPVPFGTSQAFQFHLVGADWEGRQIEFHTPLAFVEKSIADQDAGKMGDVVAAYNALSDSDERRARPIGGQRIAFAPPVKSGDTSLDTTQMTFGAINASGSSLFLPAMANAQVDVPSVRQITRNGAPSTIEFDPQFVAFNGNDIGNMGEVFAHLTGSNTPVQFPTDKTGGLVAPNFDIGGLSRAFGPVGDATQFAAGNFNPAAIFQDVKLLGCIDLSAILAALTNMTPAVAGPSVPGLQSIHTTKPGLGDVIETSYLWEVPAEHLVDQISLPIPGPFKPGAGATFSINTVVDAPLNGTPPQFSVVGKLSDFSLRLLPASDAQLIELRFNSITFSAGSNTKVDVAITFDGFVFLGPLSFVNKLQEFIPVDGFNDPPYLDLVLPPDPRPGVSVGFTQGIPTIGIGIFTLQNISFTAGFYLPLIGDSANLRLAFCERQQPFTLTVSLFGGGGFFGMDINLDGVQLIEAALEFGASVALNLGVASGSATVMGGVYYQKSGTGFEISAYFRAAGSLSVLGIITVSVEFYLALSYQSAKDQPHGGKLWGEASVTVKVKIAFFSKSVSISIEREFAGSDPTFASTIAPSDWSDYCGAFADYPA